MNFNSRTPQRSRGNTQSLIMTTPQISLSKELKQVLHERNLLTAKSRRKVCSMLDSLSPVEKNEFDKRHLLRLQAIEEIVMSESRYIKQLEVLMKFFIIPLKERSIIDAASHTTLFGQIEMIYNLNGELLNELQKDLDSVACAFIKLAPFFKLYSVYAFDYKNALLILQELTGRNPVFRKFLESTESRPEVQTKLQSLMIVPIQRVPRYRLLLQQVLLYTSPADPDFKILQESIKEVESTVQHINSVIEDQEVMQSLLNLQNSLINRTPNIVKPSRKIIKEGVLNKVTRNGSQIKRYCVLMSDIFMYCKIFKDRSKNTVVENSLQCCCIFPLKKCKVYELFPGNFKITCQGDGVILCTTDHHLGQNWVFGLRDAIDLHIQCRKTLRKESSKRKPIRKKDVKNFDVDYVLSPNKRKCDYESVFRCGENSDSDDEDQVSCFNFKTKSLKRKLEETTEGLSLGSVLTGTPKKSDDGLFKKPFTPPPLKISHSKTSTIKSPPQEVNKTYTTPYTQSRPEEHDPTYGFANRFSETKSFFRTNNIDCNHELSKTPLMDVLYPLRVNSSGSSNEDSPETWLHNRRETDYDTFNEIRGESSENFNPNHTQKRVKFDETSSNGRRQLNLGEDIVERENRKPEPFRFPEINSDGNAVPGLTLRQRIMDFFSRFF